MWQFPEAGRHCFLVIVAGSDASPSLCGQRRVVRHCPTLSLSRVMERCGIVARAATTKTRVVVERRPRGYSGASSAFGRCGDVTVAAGAAAARGAARLAPGSLCGVDAMASDGGARQATEQMRRPVLHDPGGAVAAADGPSNAAHREVLHVRISVAKAVGLPKADFLGTADPYVEIRVMCGDPLGGEAESQQELQKRNSQVVDAKTVFQAQTKVIRGSLDPVWEESFTLEVFPDDAVSELFVYFRIYDYDLIGSDDFLGHTSISLLELLASSLELNSGWRALVRSCRGAADRLDVLRDTRLRQRMPFANRIQAVHGQEATYDLSKAELFIVAEVLERAACDQALPAERTGGGASTFTVARGRGGSVPAAPHLSKAEMELLQSELARGVVLGDAVVLLHALRKGATANGHLTTGQFEGCTPLHIACLRGRGDISMALVEVFGVSLVHTAPGGRTAAMCACESGDEALAEWLICEGVPADLRDDAGRTVLFYAAKMGLPQLMAWLLGKQHLRPGDEADGGMTPLIVAVASGAKAAVVVAQQLLEAKASPDQPDATGRTPLHTACVAGDDPCVRVLLSVGKARVDVVDGAGRTPCDLALEAGLPEVTINKLSLANGRGGVGTEGGGEFGAQRQGETAVEAARRQLRAHKAAQSADVHEWKAWRTMHPKPEAWDDVLGVGWARKGASTVAEDIQIGTARGDPDVSAFANMGYGYADTPAGVLDGKPQLLLDPSSDSAREREKQQGRVRRMKNWALSFQQRSKSPTRRQADPTAGDLPPRVGDSLRLGDDQFI